MKKTLSMIRIEGCEPVDARFHAGYEKSVKASRVDSLITKGLERSVKDLIENSTKIHSFELHILAIQKLIEAQFIEDRCEAVNRTFRLLDGFRLLASQMGLNASYDETEYAYWLNTLRDVDSMIVSYKVLVESNLKNITLHEAYKAS